MSDRGGKCRLTKSHDRNLQTSEAFVDKFLLGKTSANTSIAKTSYNTDLTKWITWTTPKLL